MQSRIDRPSPTTVRTVAWISVAFVVILALVEVYYATVLAPRLPASFEIAVIGQRQSGVIDATPGGLALFGYLFAGAAFVAAIAGVVLSRSGSNTAYAVGVLISLFVPAYIGFLLGAVGTILTSDASRTSGASIYAGVGVAIGFLAVYVAPRLRRDSGAAADAG